MTRIGGLLVGLVNFITAVIWSLLGLRFVLKLFAANPDHGFVNWVYETSGEILGPFRGIFPSANLEGFVFDFTALFALVVYGLLGMLALYILTVLDPRPSATKHSKTRSRD